MAGGGGRRKCKELTLVVDVGDNKVVKAQSVVDELVAVYGSENILAVVPRSGNLYEITVKDKDAANDLSDSGFQVAGLKYDCHQVYSAEKVVSFLHMPEFIEDDVIIKKLTDLGVEVLSKVKSRVYPGTSVHDGTRYVFCKFPAGMVSLPYTMRFETGKDKYESIPVRHDKQMKVCSKCLSDQHLYADCPQNKCYRCNELGHLIRSCPADPCDGCGYWPSKCKCGNDDEITEVQVEQEMDRINKEQKRREEDNTQNTETKVVKKSDVSDGDNVQSDENIPVVEDPKVDNFYMPENVTVTEVNDDGSYKIMEVDADTNKNIDSNFVLNYDDMLPMRAGPFSKASPASGCMASSDVDSAIEGHDISADTAESMDDGDQIDGESQNPNKNMGVQRNTGFVASNRRRRLVSGLNKTPDELVKLRRKNFTSSSPSSS